MPTLSIPTSQNIDLEYDIAGLGERILAFIIDSLIRFGISIVLIVISQLFGSLGTSWNILLFYLPFLFYFPLFEILYNGQTIGKKIMNIRVVKLDGTQPGLGDYLIRWLFRLLDITLSIGVVAIICIASSAKQQRLGDMVAGTTLIRTKPKASFEDTLYVPLEEHYQPQFPEVMRLSDKDIRLIREILSGLSQRQNHELASLTAEKIKSLLNIRSTLEDTEFLQTVLADFNYLTQG